MHEAKQLEKHKSKRNFAIAPEPSDGGSISHVRKYVIQIHWASSLH